MYVYIFLYSLYKSNNILSSDFHKNKNLNITSKTKVICNLNKQAKYLKINTAEKDLSSKFDIFKIKILIKNLNSHFLVNRVETIC